MKKADILALLAALGVLGSSALAAGPAGPNIIFILTDDLGYTGVACYGSQYYQTPASIRHTP